MGRKPKDPILVSLEQQHAELLYHNNHDGSVHCECAVAQEIRRIQGYPRCHGSEVPCPCDASKRIAAGKPLA